MSILIFYYYTNIAKVRHLTKQLPLDWEKCCLSRNALLLFF